VLRPGDVLPLTIEKPAAGGRMLARADGQVVFVLGAIPGERVRATVEHIKGGVAFATASSIEEPSPDRRAVGGDPLCGGLVYSHIAYERQRALKGEIVGDAFARIARTALPGAIAVRASPEHGYRMRARLHVRHGRIGFFREGTHDLCDPAPGGQLLPATTAALREMEARLGARAHLVRALELSENVPASQRVVLMDVADDARRADLRAIVDALERPDLQSVWIPSGARRRDPIGRGSHFVTDTLSLASGDARIEVAFRRHAGAFFQANRFLLQPLVESVLRQLPDGPIVELYAGAGLFGISHAALGRGRVIAVEGEALAAADLEHNARPFIDRMRVEAAPVERFVRDPDAAADAQVILVDPPRTGMSKDAVQGILRTGALRIVYVSCDVATLARDTRKILDAGYALTHVEGFDLFPNTAHVEALVTFDRLG
jgi:23S rRNA (uracil1939-C5)-methyltransferase